MAFLDLVDIPVRFEDVDDDNLTITVEGSTTGSFSGEEFTLTAEANDESHDSRFESQPFVGTTPEDVANFVWNARTDLGGGFNGTVYIRAKVNDGTEEVISNTETQTIIMNTAPAGAVTFAQQRAGVLGAKADIDFNLIDAESNPVTVTVEASLTGDFMGEEVTAIPLTSDPQHTLLSTPLTASPTGISYRFVWQADIGLGDLDNCVYLRFTLSDGANPNEVIYNCIEMKTVKRDSTPNTIRTNLGSAGSGLTSIKTSFSGVLRDLKSIRDGIADLNTAGNYGIDVPDITSEET